MSRKAKLNELKWYRLKAKKKMKSPNPEARRKEEWLIEKLRKYEVPRSPEPVHDPEILTEEERFYLNELAKEKELCSSRKKRMFGIVCKPCNQAGHEYAEELARLSKGTVIDIKANDTIIFYRGKNYVQPKVMSLQILFLSRSALEKYRFEQSLEHTSQFIEKLEKELEEYHKHVA
ncbi:putative CRM domain-containing protein, chloroplastic, partial [Ananas comosus]